MIGGVPVQFCHPMFGEILEGPIISQPIYEPESVKKNHLFLNQEPCLYPIPGRKTLPFAAALHIWQLSPGCEVKKGV